MNFHSAKKKTAGVAGYVKVFRCRRWKFRQAIWYSYLQNNVPGAGDLRKEGTAARQAEN